MKAYFAALIVTLSAAAPAFGCGEDDLSYQYRVRDDVIAQPAGSDDYRMYSGVYYKDWRDDSDRAYMRDVGADRRANINVNVRDGVGARRMSDRAYMRDVGADRRANINVNVRDGVGARGINDPLDNRNSDNYLNDRMDGSKSRSNDGNRDDLNDNARVNVKDNSRY